LSTRSAPIALKLLSSLFKVEREPFAIYHQAQPKRLINTKQTELADFPTDYDEDRYDPQKSAVVKATPS